MKNSVTRSQSDLQRSNSEKSLPGQRSLSDSDLHLETLHGIESYDSPVRLELNADHMQLSDSESSLGGSIINSTTPSILSTSPAPFIGTNLTLFHPDDLNSSGYTGESTETRLNYSSLTESFLRKTSPSSDLMTLTPLGNLNDVNLEPQVQKNDWLSWAVLSSQPSIEFAAWLLLAIGTGITAVGLGISSAPVAVTGLALTGAGALLSVYGYYNKRNQAEDNVNTVSDSGQFHLS